MGHRIPEPLRSVMRNRQFLWLLVSETLFRFGDDMVFFGLSWSVLSLAPASAGRAMGTLMTIADVSLLMFLILGGLVADRVFRAHLLLGAHLVRAVGVGALALIATIGPLRLWHLFGVTVILALVQAVFGPAHSASVPLLVPEGHLIPANMLLRYAGMFAGLVAGPLAGAAVAHWEARSVYWATAASFLAAAICLLPVRRALVVSAPGDPGRQVGGPLSDDASFLAMVRAGLRYLRTSPRLVWAMVSAALHNLVLAASILTLTPSLAAAKLGVTPYALAFTTVCIQVGSVLGTALSGLRTWQHDLFTGAAWMFGSAALGALLLGVPLAGPMAYLTVALGGLLWGSRIAASVLIEAGLQAGVPTSMLGRVLALAQFVSFAALPVGYATAGILGDRVGVLRYLVTTALLGLVAQLLILSRIQRSPDAPRHVGHFTEVSRNL